MSFAPPDKDSEKSSGRPPLPGIPSYVDRVSAEEIWKDFCHSEKDYFERIKHNPPKTRENYGVLYGFEVIKHPTYTSALRINSPTSSVASSRARTPSVIGDGKALGTVTTGPTQASRARAMPSVTRRKELPSFTTSIVFPKYQRFSGDHMRGLENCGDEFNKSAIALKRALSVPAVTGHPRR
mmetsp:Transcript_84812/g.134003  ORF Transcript_84812/g.134003 Transcript_84812/m.134003 type:complete len:182 (+) Transcript_84812:67-612(+)